MLAEREHALGNMPWRLMEAMRRREVMARTALHEYEATHKDTEPDVYDRAEKPMTDVSEAAHEVVTELALADELLSACLSELSLQSLPRVACVNHRWNGAARAAFGSQLRWREEARCVPLPLPVPGVPARTLDSQIHRTGFSLSFLHGGDLVVQLVDAGVNAIRTISFAEDSLQPHELSHRGFAEHGPFNAGVGGVVGYRQGTESGFTFFPLVSASGTAPSEAAWVANGRWQNVLQAGNMIFLLRVHTSWWEEERITADLIDSDIGGRAAVDVTPLRDALQLQLMQDRPARGAVSAAHGHFIFHLSTQSGDKVAGALRLPAHIAPQNELGTSSTVDSVVAFARRWPSTHAIARLRTPSEEPCGEYLMLWEERHAVDFGHRTSTASVSEASCTRRFALDVVLLHVRGIAVGRQLLAPATDGPQAHIAAAFIQGGVAAIDYNAASGVVAACSLPRSGLPPPALLLWDWRSAGCLQALLFHPLPRPLPEPEPEPPGGLRPLRFPIGARVECRLGTSAWLPGVVVAHNVSAGDPGQQPLPYLVHLDRGDACYARLDIPQLIRGAVPGEELAWNERTQAMEVAATASLAIHPSRCRLAIGMWHMHAAAGALFLIDISQPSTT